jgi:hypothetical protein
MQITGQQFQVHMVAVASYSMIGPDGFWHQYRERQDFDGTFDGRNLSAQRSGGSLLMDGYQVPPIVTTSQLNISVSQDGLSMSGQSLSPLGVVQVAAQKQQRYH